MLHTHYNNVRYIEWVTRVNGTRCLTARQMSKPFSFVLYLVRFASILEGILLIIAALVKCSYGCDRQHPLATLGVDQFPLIFASTFCPF